MLVYEAEIIWAAVVDEVPFIADAPLLAPFAPAAAEDEEAEAFFFGSFFSSSSMSSGAM